MKQILLCTAILFTATVFSQTRTYHISPSDSRIGFVVTKWLVFREEGRFTRYEGTIVADPGNPSATQVSLHVQTASVDSRNPDRDGVIRSHDLLDVRRYPAMSFRSVKVEKTSHDTLLVTGDLTIRNTTKRLTVPIRFLGATTARGTGNIIGYEGEFAINRKDFGVNGFSHMVADDVVIQLQIGAIAR